jgi:hypothetical protein
MPTTSQITSIWDIESAVETAAAAWLSTILIAVGTLRTVITPSSESKFQSERPRAEVICVLGSQKTNTPEGNRMLANLSFPGKAFEIANNYQGQLQISVITSAAEESKPLHAQFRAVVRWLMAQFAYATKPLLNSDGSVQSAQNPYTLTQHIIQFVTEASTAPIYSPEEGVWKSSIHFDLRISLHAGSLQLLISS